MNESRAMVLWQQFWRCVQQLRRELQEDPDELCWYCPQWRTPPLHRTISTPNSTPCSEPLAPQSKPNLNLTPSTESQTKSFVKDPTPSQDIPVIPPTEPISATSNSANDAENIASIMTTKKQQPLAPSAHLPTTGRTNKETNQQTSSSPQSWQEAITTCQACNLGKETSRIRQQAIIGYPQQAQKTIPLLLVCDAPNYDADHLGQPLPTSDMEYLQKWLDAIQMADAYYLTNLVKCRTPGNRAPWPEEIQSCTGHLEQQLAFFQPKAILALGSSAARSLSQQRNALHILRNRELYYHFQGKTIRLFVTYSVSDVLHNPKELRAPVWQDLKRLRSYLQQQNEK